MRRRRSWVRLLPLVAVALAVAATVAVVATDDGDGGSGRPVAEPATVSDAVAVSSDAPRHRDVAALVAASDLVVRGRVAATERGRWFGDGGEGARIQSRLVTLEVTEVLAGHLADGADTVLVEEEGWLDDGRPLVVDGLAPERVGDDGVWFLVDVGDPETGAYVVLGADGRYLVDGEERLRGADGDDPLVASIEAAGLGALVGAVRSG